LPEQDPRALPRVPGDGCQRDARLPAPGRPAPQLPEVLLERRVPVPAGGAALPVADAVRKADPREPVLERVPGGTRTGAEHPALSRAPAAAQSMRTVRSSSRKT